MVEAVYIGIIVLYGLFLSFILLYSFTQLGLTINYWKSKKNNLPENLKMVVYPIVTVQLPIYNEQYVTERLIDCCMQLNYPKDKLEIQVIDDSTDNTLAISQRKVNEYKSQGYDITLVTRESRIGYKAGALAHATESCRGEFIAIFDADFMPNQDFLMQTIPNFSI